MYMRPRISPFTSVLLHRTTAVVLAFGLTSGCANLQTAASAPPACEGGLTPADNTRLAAIEQMMGEGKFYAVLAQLDAMGVQAPKVTLMRADTLRKIGKRQEARMAYEPLLEGCFRGRAQHGLGLLAASDGRNAESLAYLRQARTALPLEPNIRNDYGYALLLAHQFDEAQFEFLTVLDLTPGDSRASRNLVLLTLLGPEPAKAESLARHFGIDAGSLERLKQQAQALGTESGTVSRTERPD